MDSNFSHSPPTVSGTRNTVFYAPYTATETLNANGEQSGTGTAVLGSVAAGISFTGLVTFNGDSVTCVGVTEGEIAKQYIATTTGIVQPDKGIIV